MTSAYFRPNTRGKAVEAAGRRLTRRAPDYGTWWVRYRDAAGRLQRERTSARMAEEAERVAQELALHAEKVAQGIAKPKPVPMTCDQLFAKYIEAHAHLGSQAPMRSQVKVWFGPHYKRKPVSSVTPADCDALLDKARAGGAAQASVRQLHIRGRLIFKYALRLGARHDNPWAEVPRPSLPVRKARFLTRAQVAGLLEAAGPWRLVLLTAVLSGLRRGEIGGLQWSDIHWDEGPCGVIHVRRSWGRDTTKGGEERLVPVHPVLLPELDAAFKSAARGKRGAPLDAYVFPSPERGGMRGESWHTAKLVRRVAARAGLQLPQGFTFHDLRKTFITHLVADSGGNIGAGQQLAGHSTPAVTATYYFGRDVEFLAEAMGGLKLVQPQVAVEHTGGTRRLQLVPSPPRSTKKGQ